MLRTFRHISKSKIGTGLTAFVSIGILAGFAMADISNFGTGDIGFGMGASTLAKVGSQRVVDRDMSEVMQRRLQQVRQQRPDAD
jgi:peptidyl-prolyl cis-trans isomerase D